MDALPQDREIPPNRCHIQRVSMCGYDRCHHVHRAFRRARRVHAAYAAAASTCASCRCSTSSTPLLTGASGIRFSTSPAKA